MEHSHGALEHVSHKGVAESRCSVIGMRAQPRSIASPCAALIANVCNVVHSASFAKPSMTRTESPHANACDLSEAATFRNFSLHAPSGLSVQCGSRIVRMSKMDARNARLQRWPTQKSVAPQPRARCRLFWDPQAGGPSFSSFPRMARPKRRQKEQRTRDEMARATASISCRYQVPPTLFAPSSDKEESASQLGRTILQYIMYTDSSTSAQIRPKSHTSRPPAGKPKALGSLPWLIFVCAHSVIEAQGGVGGTVRPRPPRPRENRKVVEAVRGPAT
jgi:hypothetical protein